MSLKNIIKDIMIDVRKFPLLRLILSPIGKIRKSRYVESYQNTEEPNRIRTYKGIHEGKRCFLIGNGPSLAIKDLELIKDEISFASNKIYALYDETSWRPTYYLSIDGDFLRRYSESISKLKCKEKFIDFSMKGKCGDAIYICANPTFEISIYGQKHGYIKEEVSEFFSDGGTVTFTMIQLAIYMGFKEIYLIGNDFSMPFYKDRFGFSHKTNEKYAHFKKGDAGKKTYLNRDANLYAFQQAKKYCDEHGIIIKNATRGGKLEVFERICLEDIII